MNLERRARQAAQGARASVSLLDAPPLQRPLRSWPRISLRLAPAVAVLALLAVVLVRPDWRRGVDSARPAVAATIGLSGAPIAARFDANAMWVLTRSGLQRIDANTNRAGPTLALQRPVDLTTASGSVWVATDAGNEITRVSETTGRIVSRVALPSLAVALETASGSVWALSTAPARLFRIDPTSGRLVATIRLEDSFSPSSITAAFGSIWIGGNGILWKIDPADATITSRIHIARPAIRVVSALGALWAMSDETHPAGLDRVDPKTGSVMTVAREHDVSSLAAGGDSLWMISLRNGPHLARVDANGRVTDLRELSGSAVIVSGGRSIWAFFSIGPSVKRFPIEDLLRRK